MRLVVILGLLTAAIVSILLVENASVRKRIYFLVSGTPLLFVYLMYVNEFNAYSIFIAGVAYFTPLSLLLTVIGIMLTVGARRHREAWGGLAFSTFLAASPALFFMGAMVIQLYTEIRTGHS